MPPSRRPHQARPPGRVLLVGVCMCVCVSISVCVCVCMYMHVLVHDVHTKIIRPPANSPPHDPRGGRVGGIGNGLRV